MLRRSRIRLIALILPIYAGCVSIPPLENLRILAVGPETATVSVTGLSAEGEVVQSMECSSPCDVPLVPAEGEEAWEKLTIRASAAGYHPVSLSIVSMDVAMEFNGISSEEGYDGTIPLNIPMLPRRDTR